MYVSTHASTASDIVMMAKDWHLITFNTHASIRHHDLHLTHVPASEIVIMGLPLQRYEAKHESMKNESLMHESRAQAQAAHAGPTSNKGHKETGQEITTNPRPLEITSPQEITTGRETRTGTEITRTGTEITMIAT